VTAIGGRMRAFESASSPADGSGHIRDLHGERWRGAVRTAVQGTVKDFVNTHCAPDLQAAGVDIAAEVLREFVDGGKCVRSTFMYLGWLCGADDDRAALRAAAGLELLHAFALLQDDVMDSSTLGRGTRRIRAVASKAAVAGIAGSFRGIRRGLARGSLFGLGRANDAGKRHVRRSPG
jgi:geranylgeranyl diphosphate synthase type I